MYIRLWGFGSPGEKDFTSPIKEFKSNRVES